MPRRYRNVTRIRGGFLPPTVMTKIKRVWGSVPSKYKRAAKKYTEEQIRSALSKFRKKHINYLAAPNNKRGVAFSFTNAETGELSRSFYTRNFKRSNKIVRSNPATRIISGGLNFVYGIASGRKTYIQLPYFNNKPPSIINTDSPWQNIAAGTQATRAPTFQSIFDTVYQDEAFNYNQGKVFDTYFSINNYKSITEITNVTNVKVTLRLHEICARRDLPNKDIDIKFLNLDGSTQSILATFGSPLVCFANGLKHRQLSPGGGTTQDPFVFGTDEVNVSPAKLITYKNCYPSQSHIFNHYWSIMKTSTVTLSPGASHRHISKHRLNYRINLLDVISLSDLTVDFATIGNFGPFNTNVDVNNYGIRGLTSSLMMEAHTSPMIGSIGSDSVVSTPPARLAVSHNYTMSISFLQDKSRSANFTTALKTSGQSSFETYTNVAKDTVDDTDI